MPEGCLFISSRFLSLLGLTISGFGTFLIIYGSLDKFIKLKAGNVTDEVINGKTEHVTNYEFDFESYILWPGRRLQAAKLAH